MLKPVFFIFKARKALCALYIYKSLTFIIDLIIWLKISSYIFPFELIIIVIIWIYLPFIWHGIFNYRILQFFGIHILFHLQLLVKNIKHSFVIFFKLFLLIIKYIKSSAHFCKEISLSFKNSKITVYAFAHWINLS